MDSLLQILGMPLISIFEFIKTNLFEVITVFFLALVPVFAWIFVWFKKDDEESKHVFLVFFLGTLTVLPILLLQWLWALHPEFDFYAFVDNKVSDPLAWFVITYVFAAMLEEVVKGYMIYYVDFTTVEIKTINNCIKYNLLVALGFAFSENLLYFYSGITNESFTGFSAMFVFRSMFTVCAHMIFSSITGYYYGLSKFSDPIVEQEKWLGVSHKFVRKIAHFFNKDPRAVLPIFKWWTGIFLAMVLHGAYNLCLVWDKVYISVLIVVGGFLFVRYLSKRQTGNLVLAITGKKRASLMAPKDEDVVLELLGMWTNEGRYDEVEQICDRLLQKDPDNRVVKLFKAKALDKKNKEII